MKYLILITLLFNCSSFNNKNTSRDIAQSEGQRLNTSIRNHPAYELALNNLVDDLKHIKTQLNHEKWIFLENTTRELADDFLDLQESEKMLFEEKKSKYKTKTYLDVLKSYVAVAELSSASPFFSIDLFSSRRGSSAFIANGIIVHKVKRGSTFIPMRRSQFLTKKTIRSLSILLKSKERSVLLNKDLDFYDFVARLPSQVKIIIFDALKKINVNYIGRTSSNYCHSLVAKSLNYSTSQICGFSVFNPDQLTKKNTILLSGKSELKEKYRKEFQNLENLMNSTFVRGKFNEEQRLREKLLLNDTTKVDQQKVGYFISKYLFSLDKELVIKERDWKEHPDDSEEVLDPQEVFSDQTLYQQTLNSLVKDMSSLIRVIKEPRWIFNYNANINVDQYNEEIEKGDGTLSPDNKSFLETGRSQARTFFKSHTFSAGMAGNGLYFFIDPVQQIRHYSNRTYPLGTLLKLPKGTRIFSRHVRNFLSKHTVSLINKLVDKGYLKVEQRYNFNALMDHLYGEPMILIYDAIRKSKIDLFSYQYSDSGFLNIDSSRHDTAFVLINEDLLSKKNSVIYAKSSFAEKLNNKDIKVLDKIGRSDAGASLGDRFNISQRTGERTSNEEIGKIIKNYFFKREELKVLKGKNEI